MHTRRRKRPTTLTLDSGIRLSPLDNSHSSYGDTSAKGTAVWMQDTAGPVSAFTTPLEGSTTPGSGVVNLSGTSSDAVSGLAGAEIWVEGGEGWQPLEVVAGAWSATWDTTTVPDGTYFVQVRAMDNAGNVGDPAQVFFEVDNGPPVVEPAPRVTDESHPHAVAEVQRPGGTDTYAYDASGTQTQRTEGGVTYNQTVDAEGRIVSVQNTGTGDTWTFTYDGDGNRVRQVGPDGTATLLVAGRFYEVTLDAGGQQTAVKRYYTIAGQQIALRDAGGTFYLLTDHVGSVVAVVDGTGAVVAEQRYRPFGQPRLTPGIGQTDHGFTGQRSLSAAGLQDFNARWLDVALGTFSSADSWTPSPSDPPSLNRYGYALNNPLRYTDPTGHRACEGPRGECSYPGLPGRGHASSPLRGLYCAEAVLLAMCEAREVHSDLIPWIATGLCAGMSRTGGMCGPSAAPSSGSGWLQAATRQSNRLSVRS